MQHAGKFLALVFVGSFIGGVVSGQTIGGITDRGAITQWLVLGPYNHTAGCNLPAECVMPATACDYMTDGAIIADEWEPTFGDSVASQCNGAARCTGWDCQFASTADPSINCGDPAAVPKVALYDSPEPRGYIDLNGFYSGIQVMGGNGSSGPPDNVMAYAWTYVYNHTGAPQEVYIGHNSDDSYRVLVNHVEAGAATRCAPDNPSPMNRITFFALRGPVS